MERMVNIFLFGKKYEVPENLTIMTAMEYAGYQLVRGCGCRNGFCGACATIYRIKGDKELKACLACQTKVEDNMYVATLPFFPLVKQVYDMENNKKVVITYGTFDLFHKGHYNILKRAKELGDYLIVGVTADDFVFAFKRALSPETKSPGAKNLYSIKKYIYTFSKVFGDSQEPFLSRKGS